MSARSCNARPMDSLPKLESAAAPTSAAIFRTRTLHSSGASGWPGGVCALRPVENRVLASFLLQIEGSSAVPAEVLAALRIALRQDSLDVAALATEVARLSGDPTA